MIRAFIGIGLPDDIRSALSVQQFLLPLPRRVQPDAFHLTLAFLGEIGPDVLETTHEALLTLRAEKFQLSLSGLGLFGSERPRAAWAGVCRSDPLTNLQAKIERLARQAGCHLEHRRFVPHVTLGRFPPPPKDESMRLERAVALGTNFTSPVWEVHEFTLWQSHLGGKTPYYERLVSYPLLPSALLGH